MPKELEAVEDVIDEPVEDVAEPTEDQVDEQPVDEVVEPGDQEPVAEEPDDSWRQPYEELGFADVETPEQANTRLMDAYRLERQRREEAQHQAKYYQTIHTQLSTRDQPQAEPVAKQPSGVLDSFSSNWIELNEKMLSEYVTKDAEGNSIFTPDAPEELRQQVHQFRQQKAQWSEVIGDPRKFAQAIDERLEAKLTDRVTGVLSQRDEQQADQRAEQEFLAQNDWLFVRDPVTGQASDQLTSEGLRFSKMLQGVAQAGVQRRSDQLQFALDRYNSQRAAAQQAPAAQRLGVQPTIQQQRMKALGVKNGSPAKPRAMAGVSDGPGGGPSGVNRMSLGQRLVAELQDEGVDL